MKNSGVYIFKLNNEVMYVGQSGRLQKRLANHHYGFGCDVYIIPCTDNKKRIDLERKLINHLKPKLNGSAVEGEVSTIPYCKATRNLDILKKLKLVDEKIAKPKRACKICSRGIRLDNATGVCTRCQKNGRLKIKYDLDTYLFSGQQGNSDQFLA